MEHYTSDSLVTALGDSRGRERTKDGSMIAVLVLILARVTDLFVPFKASLIASKSDSVVPSSHAA
jgi:hypothetical protein